MKIPRINKIFFFYSLIFILISAFLLLPNPALAVEPTAIMPLGDSITYDNFSSDTRPTGMREGYRSYLWHLLTDSGYNVDFVGSVVAGQTVIPLFDPDNEGHPGWTSAQLASNVYSFLTSHPADIVLLHIGTNGVTSDPGAVADILDAVDRYEADASRQVLVVLALIINRSCLTATPPCAESTTTTAFNDAVYAMAQDRISGGDNILIADMETDAGLDYRLAPVGDMIDNLHPNDGGYAKMADVWFDVLQTALPVPTEPLPYIDILSPTNGAVVDTPFSIEFQYGNWTLAQGSTHVRLLIDDIDQGAYFSSDPISVASIGPGSHIVKLVLANADGSLTNFFDGISVARDNLALNRPAVASSVEAAGLEASKADDGIRTTRWSSAFSDNQWIYLDLGSIYTVSRVVLNWETAYASRYAIQVSADATNWTTVYTELGGNGGIDDVVFTGVDARYVRMQGLKRATVWGYSLYEFEVYGTASDSSPVLTTLSVSPATATLMVGEQAVFSASGFDQYGDAYPVSVSWSASGGGSIDGQGVYVAATAGGPYVVQASAEGIVGTATVTVAAEAQTNLALNRPAVASSIEAAGLEASKADDGIKTTRWASGESDNQWIYVDLGGVRTVSRVILNWETAYASRYAIQVSADATNWTTVYTELGGNGGIDDVVFTAVDTRYVRMQGIQRATVWGYSLYEFEVYRQ